MELYKINAEMERLQNRLEWNEDIGDYVDLDTGEILTEEEIKLLFDGLQMDKEEAMRCLVGMILSDRAQAEAIKLEEKRLAGRRKAFERRAEKYFAIIDAECAGVKKDFGIATMKYTTSHPLECDDAAAAIKWLEDNDHKDCVKVTKELKKTEAKSLLKSGEKIPGCRIADKKSPSLK